MIHLLPRLIHFIAKVAGQTSVGADGAKEDKDNNGSEKEGIKVGVKEVVEMLQTWVNGLAEEQSKFDGIVVIETGKMA